MNQPTLVQHGILNEQSDFRAHVCINVKNIYIFPTQDGKSTISTGNYRERTVYTGDIITAKGYAVPVKDIKNVIRISYIKDDIPTDESDKGRLAEIIFHSTMNRLGKILRPATEQEQKHGCDFISEETKKRIEVKYDEKGGDKELGGTGNLFLQTFECNPNKKH